MLLNLPIILALLRMLSVTHKPVPCAILYAALTFGFGLLTVMAGLTTVLNLIMWTGVRFLVSAAYFWALEEFSDSGIWWSILPCGVIVSYF